MIISSLSNFFLQPYAFAAFTASYCALFFYAMFWYAKQIPVRIYYDESKDETIAMFVHPLMPFCFSKKNLPHRSFGIINKAMIGRRFSNGKIKLIMDPAGFNLRTDFNRLML